VRLACALAIALSACGDDATAMPDGGTTASPDGGGSGDPDGGVVEEDPYEPPPDLAPFGDPSALRSTIDAELDSLGGVPLTALVTSGDTTIYERDPDEALIPASNTKLFTTAAAFDLFGEDRVFDIAAYSAAPPSAGGAIAGDLHVVAHTFLGLSSDFYPSTMVPFQDLARRLTALGVTSVGGRVVLSGELSYDGDRFGSYDAARERTEAANPLLASLNLAGITAADVTTAASAPDGLTELARTSSRTLSVVAWKTNDVSHNELADALARGVGIELAADAALGPGRVVQWYEDEIGVLGLALSDGSGLSYDNRVSARHVVSLLDFMEREHPTFERTFSIAGLPPGTLGSRLGGDDTFGRFYGKTGSLNVSIALSGVLFQRYDGRRYHLSLIANGLTPARQTEVRGVFDRVVAAVAADWRGLGARPIAPVLESVAFEGELASVRFTTDPIAEGYLVSIGDDPYAFDRAAARYVRTSPLRVRIEPGETRFVRVSSFARGLESDASDVYAIRRGSDTRVLVVDGNDRWQREPAPENMRGAAHELASLYADALAEATIETADNDAVTAEMLAAHDLVIWSLGEESEIDHSFEPAEQALLSTYLAGGGALFVSGSEIGWDLVERGEPTDQAFFEASFGATYVSDDAGGFLADGTGPFAAIGRFGFMSPRALYAEYPDAIAPSAGSTELLRYAEGATAAVGQSSPRVVYLAFPFESIERTDDRRAVMDASVEFLGVPR
jgi:D-alanyl-D-alanine carboxypeptidase